jgi:Kef-type K+ transport system membrane component KefB
MRAIVTLFIFLAVGYVGSRRFVSVAAHRYPWNGFLVTGAEFLILGAVLGPGMSGLITRDVLADLEPIIYLTLGSIGLLIGIDVTWRSVRRTSGVVFRVLVYDAVVVIAVVSTFTFLLLRYLFPTYPVSERFLGAAVLGICAAINSPTIIALLSRTLPARGPFTQAARIYTALNPFVPLLLFGVLFTVIHPRIFGYEAPGAGLLWWVFLNGVAVVLGLFMVMFTRERCSDNEMLLLIAGTVLVVGGFCYFLQLSSLYTGLVMGFVVGNLSRKRDQIHRELHLIEKILFVAFLILLGASLELDNPWVLALAVSYLGLRLVLKVVVTGRLVTRLAPGIRGLGQRCGLVFAAQGGVALAVALDFELASETGLSAVVLTIVAVAVVVSDLLAVVFARREMEQTGEVAVPAGRKRRGRRGA